MLRERKNIVFQTQRTRLTETDEENQAADIYFPTDSDVVLLCYAHASDFTPSARELSQLIQTPAARLNFFPKTFLTKSTKFLHNHPTNPLTTQIQNSSYMKNNLNFPQKQTPDRRLLIVLIEHFPHGGKKFESFDSSKMGNEIVISSPPALFI